MTLIMTEMEESRIMIEESLNFFHNHELEIIEVDKALLHLKPWFIDARPDFNMKSIDICFSGNKNVLEEIFKAFRNIGYEPSNRPGTEPAEYFSCFWRYPDKEIKFWLSFTSTQCTRIKVGTKMVEQAVYETVCE